MSRIKNFIKKLEDEIKPRTKGAPQRRELWQKICRVHDRHVEQLEAPFWLRTERRGVDGDGQPCGIRRHCPPDAKKRQVEIEKKQRDAVVEKITALVEAGNNISDAIALAKEHGLLYNTTFRGLSMSIWSTLHMIDRGRSAEDVLKDGGCIYLGRWKIEATQAEDRDYNYYSKSWHNSYGPKVTVSCRCLTLTHPKRKRALTYNLKSWAGNFVAKAVVELGLYPKKTKVALKIRLNKAYDAALIAEKRGYRIYSRTLLGAHVDYAIVSPLGMVYHDKDRGNLVKGLHNKIRSQTRKLQGLVDWKACKKLGFCDEGIKEFCGLFNLKTNAEYTAREIEEAVKKNLAAAAPFIAELRTLAESLNYKSELLKGE